MDEECIAVNSMPEGYGGAAALKSEEKLVQTRREQGYGGGSGVGA